MSVFAERRSDDVVFREPAISVFSIVIEWELDVVDLCSRLLRLPDLEDAFESSELDSLEYGSLPCPGNVGFASSVLVARLSSLSDMSSGKGIDGMEVGTCAGAGCGLVGPWAQQRSPAWCLAAFTSYTVCATC